MRQARAWRVPPRWSACDWFDELRAEGAAAAIQAEGVYDPGRGVPFGAYIHLCVRHRLLERYHKEWSHALRWVYVPELPEYSIEDVPCSPSESDDLQGALARLSDDLQGALARLSDDLQGALARLSDDLQGALARLIESDRRLIDRLYWRGETESEVGSSLGISQQAVSKRKRSVLRKLRRLLNPRGRR